MGFRIEPIGPDMWRISHTLADGSYRLRGSQTDVRAWLAGLELEEADVVRALDSTDRRRLCAVGWHRGGWPGGSKGPEYFHFEAGIVGRILIYRRGSLPFRFSCLTIKGIGPDARPWLCSVCKEEIGPD